MSEEESVWFPTDKYGAGIDFSAKPIFFHREEMPVIGVGWEWNEYKLVPVDSPSQPTEQREGK